MKPKKLRDRPNLLPTPPLRLLREEIGLQRGPFAQQIGCSYETVKKIESGEIGISPDIAIRAMLAFGVRPDSLIDSSVTPRDLSGRRYTDEAYHLWKAKIPRDPATAEQEIRQASDQVCVLLEVSCRMGRLPAARALLGRFLWSASTDLGIRLDYSRGVKKRGVPPERDLANAAKVTGERLLRRFRDSRAAYKKYMAEDFAQESAKLLAAKTAPAGAAYQRLRSKAAQADDSKP